MLNGELWEGRDSLFFFFFNFSFYYLFFFIVFCFGRGILYTTIVQLQVLGLQKKLYLIFFFFFFLTFNCKVQASKRTLDNMLWITVGSS